MSVVRCACSHLTAAHAALDDAKGQRDYHAQYSEGGFLSSLEQTRRRQARRIITRLRAHLPHPDGLLDFGAGRGWFLDECLAAGIPRVAGADTSELSVLQLRARGIEALQLGFPEGERWALPMEQLTFRPQVLSLLDVVEHFPPAHAAGLLRHVVEAVSPKLVVLKVPIASGVLHQTARLLNGLGLTAAPLEQLYQVGTFPAHYSYFTRRSMEHYLAQVGLASVEVFGDRDFEPASLTERARPLQALPSSVASLAGAGIAFAASVLHMEDSAVFLARPLPRG